MRSRRSRWTTRSGLGVANPNPNLLVHAQLAQEGEHARAHELPDDGQRELGVAWLGFGFGLGLGLGLGVGGGARVGVGVRLGLGLGLGLGLRALLNP